MTHHIKYEFVSINFPQIQCHVLEWVLRSEGIQIYSLILSDVSSLFFQLLLLHRGNIHDGTVRKRKNFFSWCLTINSAKYLAFLPLGKSSIITMPIAVNSEECLLTGQIIQPFTKWYLCKPLGVSFFICKNGTKNSKLE